MCKVFLEVYHDIVYNFPLSLIASRSLIPNYLSSLELNHSLLHHINQLTVMRRDDDRFPITMKTIEYGHDFLGIFWIKIPGGFISYNDVRVMDQCACDSDSLSLSSGKSSNKGFFFGEKSYFCEYFRKSLSNNLIRVAGNLHSKNNVLPNRFCLKKLEILKDDSDSPSVKSELLWFVSI